MTGGQSTGIATPVSPGAGDSRRSIRLARRGVVIALPPLIVFCCAIGVWLLASYVLLNKDQRFLLPPPQQVVRVGFLNWTNLSEILTGLWSTAQVTIVGLILAIAIGVCFAIFMDQARWIERSFYPYAVVIQAIPIIAIVPLIGFWFEFNFRSRVIVCVLVSLFPVITNTLFGLQSVDEGLRDLFKLHGAGRLALFWKLKLPNAMPAMFAGFRIAAATSVVGAIVGDFFFRQGAPGIGRLIDIYREDLATEQMFTATFFASLLGLVIFWFVGLIGDLAIRSWHESARRS